MVTNRNVASIFLLGKNLSISVSQIYLLTELFFGFQVTGRVVLTPEPKECYVAYHESAPQQLVELAFRLTFGLHL